MELMPEYIRRKLYIDISTDINLLQIDKIVVFRIVDSPYLGMYKPDCYYLLL